MELTPMQYKDYVWPHNPRTYSIRYERQVAVHKIPFGNYAAQDLGLTRRVMTGEGEFFGAGAYTEFKKLASVFYGGGPGTLIHPVWQSAKAYFVRLSLAQEPRKDYVRYRFTFWEEFDRYSQGLTRESVPAAETAAGGGEAEYYVVVRGDTLWGISRRRGLSLRALLELNPEIRNPNVIYVGQRIRVR